MMKGFRYILITLAMSLVLAMFFYFAAFVKNLELAMVDTRMRLLRSREMNPLIQVVGVDQETISRFGDWPLTRGRYGEFLENIAPEHPAGTAFDIFFIEPQNTLDAVGAGQPAISEDQKFQKAIKHCGFPVLLGSYFEGTGINLTPVRPLPQLEAAAAGTGFVNAWPDQDLCYRKVPLVYEYREPNGELRIAPSLDLLGYLELKGLSMEQVKVNPRSVLIGKMMVPTNYTHEMLVDFFFPRPGGGVLAGFPIRSLVRYFDRNRVPTLSGKLTLVGISTLGMGEDVLTPAGRVFGVMVHANALNTLLSGKFLRELPPIYNLVTILIIIILFGIMIPYLNNAVNAALATLGFITFFTALNFILFAQGYWLAWITPLFTIFSCYLSVTTLQFLRTHALFKTFAAPEVVDRMLRSEEAQKHGGEEEDVSVLFSDIRGFTALSEKMNPVEVMDHLNEYHGRVVKVFDRNRGTILNYIGDAHLVVFGAPVKEKDHAYLACRAALELQDELALLREKWKLEGKVHLEAGVGICTGKVALGIVGSAQHKQYTVIGDSVNTASRIQGLSHILESPVIISAETFRRLGDRAEVGELPPQPVKGKEEPLTVYGLISLR